MTQPNYLAIPIPRPKSLAIVCALIAALLLIAMIPLVASPMKVPGGDCGTIFASSDTWKYNSFGDAASDEAGRSVRSPADLDNYADDLVDIMMSDLAFGSAVYDQCKERHTTRLIWIAVVGVPAIVIGSTSVFLFVRNRRNAQPQPRQGRGDRA
jgi:hypothetical protein